MSSETAALPTGLAGLRFPVTQVSLAVRDLDRTMELYHRAFGWAPWQVFDHVPPMHHRTELRGEAVEYALRGAEVYVGALNFELLEPLEGPNLWTELIDRRGEGIASIATMFAERVDGDAVKAAFRERYGIAVSMKADIGDHIEYYYLDTEDRFGCLIESGSGHAIDYVRPARVYPTPEARPGPSPMSGIVYPITGVTLVTSDLDARMRAFHDAFGWGPWARYASGVVATGAPAAETRVADLRIQLLEPGLDGGPWRAYLDAGGDGLAGIGVTVRSAAELAAARDQFGSLGVDVLAAGETGGRPWLTLDSQEPFKTLITIGLGSADEVVEPDSIWPPA